VDSEAIRLTTIHPLHWETLEGLELWHKALLVSMSRAFVGFQTCVLVPSCVELRTSSKSKSKRSSFNILFVVARDLRINPGREDVEPFMTLRILIAIAKELGDASHLPMLRFEVVRPGSHKALVGHLEKVREREGPGYFHLIHFDMHGSVSQFRESGHHQAYLHFNSMKNLEQLAKKETSAVANLVNEHQIKIAIVNACKSAVARRGVTANLAAVFLRAGIPLTVAMSFKFLSSTASAFLHLLYRSFVVDSSTFYNSIAKSREWLRQNPYRVARFHRKCQCRTG
jgi:hypothetical protein